MRTNGVLVIQVDPVKVMRLAKLDDRIYQGLNFCGVSVTTSKISIFNTILKTFYFATHRNRREYFCPSESFQPPSAMLTFLPCAFKAVICE